MKLHLLNGIQTKARTRKRLLMLNCLGPFFLLLVKIILYWRNNSQANDHKLVNLQPLGNCFTRGWKRPLKGCASPSALRWHNGVNNLFCFVLFIMKNHVWKGTKRNCGTGTNIHLSEVVAHDHCSNWTTKINYLSLYLYINTYMICLSKI